MSQRLINHSPDLKALRDSGYEIEVQNGFLLIHHIPYVQSDRDIYYGTLACQLNLISDERTTKPASHVIFFQGEHPCDKNGTQIQSIKHQSSNQIIFNNFVVNHSFSNKPPNGYNDYYELVKTYCDIISSPAKSIDDSVTEKTFKTIIDSDIQTTFQYIDSNSSRANINLISDKLKSEKIGIIGLGGTGAYILDFIAKTPIKEIRLFDGDKFLQHNSFRSPGAASIETLNQNMSKVEYYKSIYSNIHNNILAYSEFITSDNLMYLDGLSCVFISLDRGSIKKEIMEYLLDHEISFIDVGMGINRVDDSLLGTIRVTTGSKTKKDHLIKRISFDDDKKNEYNTNIQIVELNALNASLAVIKWKKLCGFYNDLEKEFNTTYSINVSQLLNDETTA